MSGFIGASQCGGEMRMVGEKVPKEDWKVITGGLASLQWGCREDRLATVCHANPSGTAEYLVSLNTRSDMGDLVLPS